MVSKEPSFLSTLHRLKAVALEGLQFTGNPYDIARYERLLEITASSYSEILGIDNARMLEQLRSEIGVATPRLGADAAVPNELKQILLLRRSDGRGWGLPGGWADVHESPAQAAVREVWEEAGLKVEPLAYAAISCKGPGLEAGLYHQVNIVTVMKPVPANAAIVLSHEHTDYRWIGEFPRDIELHAGHEVQIRKIFEFLGAGAGAKPGLAVE